MSVLDQHSLAPKRAQPATLLDRLCASGAIDADTYRWALDRRHKPSGTVADILLCHGCISDITLRDALAETHGLPIYRDAAPYPDAAAIRRLGADFCARHRVVPLCGAGAITPLLCVDPDGMERLRPHLEQRLGTRCQPLLATETQAADLLMRYAGPPLADRAEARSPAAQSCRHMSPAPKRGLALLCCLIGAILAAPAATIVAGSWVALFAVCVNGALLLYALASSLRPKRTPPTGPRLARYPVVSILLPLFREEDIAAILVERVAHVDYPRDLLDICLLIEEGDTVTARTLARTQLPPWVRVLRVAPGGVQTKPRAMNLALDFCRGAIIGIYDAEDAPAPDQIHRVVHQFARSGPDVAALQGRLAFYNARATWLTRCFFLDYATWFSLILPAIRRLDWAVPLGGTTVFLRRGPLEEVGGWDAHNVTEDADLGLRLTRAGYRTDLLDSTTLEEATASSRAWIKQRSRWQKGYALTWAAHIRAPLSLWRDLGAWRFLGMQVLFLGSLLSAATAPFLWLFWLPVFGAPHPFFDDLSHAGAVAVMVLLAAYFILNAGAQARATCRLGRPDLLFALPWMHAYHALASAALVKAAIELVYRPFFWDKTAHGVTAPDQHCKAASRPAPSRVAVGFRKPG